MRLARKRLESRDEEEEEEEEEPKLRDCMKVSVVWSCSSFLSSSIISFLFFPCSAFRLLQQFNTSSNADTTAFWTGIFYEFLCFGQWSISLTSFFF